MSLQNLMEMESFSQPSSLNERDGDRPIPKPRPRPRERTTTTRMSSSSPSFGKKGKERDVDDVMSFSSAESGSDRKGLLYSAPPPQRKKRTASSSAFENNAFVDDDPGSKASPPGASGNYRAFANSSRKPFMDSPNPTPSPKARQAPKPGLIRQRTFSIERTHSEEKKPPGRNHGEEEDADDDARSDVTYTLEDETKAKMKTSGKPPKPPTKRSKIPKLQERSSRLGSASTDQEAPPDERPFRKGKKKEDHLAVEIEPEEENVLEVEQENITEGNQNESLPKDEAETVSVSSAAAKDSVKSRFSKLFRTASSSESKKNKTVDSSNATDKESAGGGASSSVPGGKSSFVSKWKSIPFLKGTSSRAKQESVSEVMEGGEVKAQEGMESELTGAEGDDQANANLESSLSRQPKKRERVKNGKSSETRILMPMDPDAVKSVKSVKSEEDDENIDASIKSYSVDESEPDPDDSPQVRRKDKIPTLEKKEEAQEVEEPEESKTLRKLTPLAKIWRGKSKSTERDPKPAVSDDEKPEKIEKEGKVKSLQKLSRKDPTKSEKRKDKEGSKTKAEAMTDEQSEAMSESEAESKSESEKKETPEPKRKKKVRPKEKIQLTDTVSGKDLLFGVTIHQSDLLPLDPNVIHPVVKVTVLFQNGQYMKATSGPNTTKPEKGKADKKKKKSKKDSETVGFTENVSESILPIMSQPCQARFSIPTFAPTWNELLVFEEPFKRFAVPDESHDSEKEPIIFFEVMDFLPMNSNNGNAVSISGFHGTDNGWYKVAWAFLKPIGANGFMNLNKKLRLQLYKPVRLRAKGKHPGPEVYSWWKSGKMEKIRCSLYITPKGIIPPETRVASLRQLLSMKKEQLTQAILDSQLATKKKRELFKKSVSDLKDHITWNRMEGQSCKPPNKLLATLPTSQIESLNIVISGNVHCTKFSPCGRKLAAGLDTDELHVILIFEVPSWTLVKTLKGHHGIVYDITWKIYELNDDISYHYLASASADSTVRIWKARGDEDRSMTLIRVLHHPSYVYSVKFHPTHPSIVATGCFDGIIRIWDFKPEHDLEPETRGHSHKKGKKGRVKENTNRDQVTPIILLDKHGSFVNALLFDLDGQHLFSGDGTACLFKWSSTSLSQKKHWKLEKDAKLHPGDIPVNSIDLHPSGNRILVQLRDNFIKVLDIQTFIPLQTFSGLNNERFQIRSCFSPCGNLVLSGSEDSTLCIWDADTGKILQFVCPRNHPHCIVSSVDYHPHDYYIAIGVASAICEPSPVLVYHYDPPVRMNYPMLKKSAMKFKQSLDKNRRSQSTDSVNMNDTGSKSSRPLPAKRVDSTEKFISIIQKLDTALYFAQQRNKKRLTEAKSSTCLSSPFPPGDTSQAVQPEPSFKSALHDLNKNRVSEMVHSIEKKLEESSAQYQSPSPSPKTPKASQRLGRPKSASSITKEKRDKFRKSHGGEDDEEGGLFIKSDSEQRQRPKRRQEPKPEVEVIHSGHNDQPKPVLVVSHSLDLDTVDSQEQRPKPLKRRLKMVASS